MSTELNERIASVKLTPKLRQVADYVSGHTAECCFITAAELAQELNVSFSSVIRFTREMGFAGYQEFQTFLQQEQLKDTNRIQESIVVPAERLNEIRKKGRKAPVKELVTAQVLENLQNTITANTQEQFDAACRIIMASDIKSIISHRGSSCVATFLHVIMRQTIHHVYNYADHGTNIFDFVSDLTDKDCLIAIAFPRYSRLIVLACEMAKKNGAKIIAITNKPTSPIAQMADVTLLAACDNSEYYNSYVAALYTAELLSGTLCRLTGYDNEERLSRINEYTVQVGNY